MALNTVTVTWNEQDIGEGALAGSVTFALSAVEADQADGIEVHPAPAKTYFFVTGTGTSGPLVANDNAGLAPAGSYYKITVAISGQQPYSFNAPINFASGASQTLAFLYANQAVPAAQYSQYLPLPSGTPSAGQVPVAVEDGSTATAWGSAGGGGSGTVTSVNDVDPDDSGNVTLTAASVGAASTGALSSETTIRANADTALSTAIGNETTRAETAEGTLTTAIGTETTRAETAEALKLAKASNLSDLASASTAYNNISPMTTKGDMEYESSAGTAARLPVGSAGQVLGVSGGVPAWGAGMTLLGTAGLAGFTLVNGTPTIISWTAPNDGLLHRVTLFTILHVTSTETGGMIDAAYTTPDGAANAGQIYTGAQATGAHSAAAFTFIIGANTTFSLTQASALTGGAAVLWAEIWGS